jgi:hypothetical protein
MPGKTKTIAELRKELTAKERQLSKLRIHRKTLAARLGAVDRQISTLAGESPQRVRGKKAGQRAGKRGKKATRKVRTAKKGKAAGKRATRKPLVHYIQKVLGKTKKGMRVKDMVQAVIDAGYHTTSKHFYRAVASQLRKRKNFRRVSRGMYKLAG